MEFLNKKFPNRLNVIFKDSLLALKDFSTFPEGTIFDFIYIDGNHSYDFVKADLEAWWPKLKSGGAICGDDYQEGYYQVTSLDFGVVKAVDEFRAKSSDLSQFQLFKDQFVLVKK